MSWLRCFQSFLSRCISHVDGSDTNARVVLLDCNWLQLFCL